LTLSTSGAKTLTSLTTIQGDFTTSGSITASTEAAIAVSGNLAINNTSQLTVAGYNFSVTGTTGVTGTLVISSATGTKTFTGDVTINSGGTWNNSGNEDITITGDLTNNQTFTAGSGNLALSGDYANNGAFTAGSGKVTLAGSGKQTLTGTMTTTSAFYDLTITNNSGTYAGSCAAGFTGTGPSVDFGAAATITNNYTINTAGVKVEYQTGADYTIANINWHDQDSNDIIFRNSEDANDWNLNVSGTQTAVHGVDVARSDATGSASAIDADDGSNTDCLNNPNWIFTEIISIDINTDGVISYGLMNSNESKSTIDLGDMQTAGNDGNVTENFNIVGMDSASWELGDTTGSDQYVHMFCNDTTFDCSSPPTNYTAFNEDSYTTWATGITASSTADFQLRITTPNPSTVYTQQTVDITVQAIKTP
ncbi:MAG: hypothetical protein V1692_02065, partial [bacterium]